MLEAVTCRFKTIVIHIAIIISYLILSPLFSPPPPISLSLILCHTHTHTHKQVWRSVSFDVLLKSHFFGKPSLSSWKGSILWENSTEPEMVQDTDCLLRNQLQKRAFFWMCSLLCMHLFYKQRNFLDTLWFNSTLY